MTPAARPALVLGLTCLLAATVAWAVFVGEVWGW